MRPIGAWLVLLCSQTVVLLCDSCASSIRRPTSRRLHSNDLLWTSPGRHSKSNGDSQWNNSIPEGPETTSKMKVRSPFIVDQSERVRIFHGINAVEKQFPWYPEYMLNTSRLRLFKEWGFNVVRLGVMWSGLEPADGQFNETYVSILGDIIHKLGQQGIYVILDMHQDVLSSKFQSYDGAPLWLMDRLPPSPHPYPWPIQGQVVWTDGYLSQACGRAFQAIYDNVNGTLDRLAAFWGKVAQSFHGENFTNVLGYELINEPWAGDIYSDASLLEPGIAGSVNLMPMYNHLNVAIRSQDDDSLLFYEPVTWGVVSTGKALGTGFTSVPGGAEYANRSVLSFHYYCWLFDANAQHSPYTTLRRLACDGLLGPASFTAVSQDVRTTHAAAFLTEFGICNPDGAEMSAATEECNYVMRLADEHLVSWTYWDTYILFNDSDGSVNWPAVRQFVRPYARAVGGVPLVMKYDKVSKAFRLKFSSDTHTQAADSEIFVPSLHYPAGIDVHLTGNASWTYTQRQQALFIKWMKTVDFSTENIVDVQFMPKN